MIESLHLRGTAPEGTMEAVAVDKSNPNRPAILLKPTQGLSGSVVVILFGIASGIAAFMVIVTESDWWVLPLGVLLIVMGLGFVLGGASRSHRNRVEKSHRRQTWTRHHPGRSTFGAVPVQGELPNLVFAGCQHISGDKGGTCRSRRGCSYNGLARLP